ncbi:hypothetical protein AB0B57_17070 [Micromonospora sp. NPDC049101]|uniref:hypothetical protein n=1 Tax=Micromonospora sp. NPDC049101 TaxID=3155032 RepID=UPI0033C8EAB6
MSTITATEPDPPLDVHPRMGAAAEEECGVLDWSGDRDLRIGPWLERSALAVGSCAPLWTVTARKSVDSVASVEDGPLRVRSVAPVPVPPTVVW